MAWDDSGPPQPEAHALSDRTPGAFAGPDTEFRARLLDELGEAVVATDRHDVVLYWNRAAARLYGWTAAEAVGRNISDLTPATSPRGEGPSLMAALEAAERWTGEREVRRKDGNIVRAAVTRTPVLDGDGTLTAIISVSRDITRQHMVERQMGHAQRMESLGRLAGGIAHEFNNLMTVVVGYTDIDASLPECPPQIRADLDEIRAAATAAASLSNELLAFASEQAGLVVETDLNRVVSGLQPMLERAVPQSTQLDIQLCGTAWPIEAEAGQLDQVVVQLVLNAVDAVQDGGTITVATRNLELGADGQVFGQAVPAGRYACLFVRDTGTGIAPDVIERVFEPFFTTKGVGEGTGLGLSVCYGIVRRSGGQLLANSTPGAGTTFTVLLPATPPPAAG